MLALLLLAAQSPAPAREPPRPGFWARLDEGAAAAFRRLYEKEDADVTRGNALAAEGKGDEALKGYDKARERLPDSPVLAFDRASALLEAGDASKAAEAASEASKALQSGDESLRPKAAYDLGLAGEALGHAEDAMQSYKLALGLDPNDRDSKVNLELLLRAQQQQKDQKQSGQKKDQQQQKQEGKQQQQEKKGGEQQQQDQQKQAGQQQPKEEPKPQAGEQQQKPPDQQQREQQAKADEKPVDRSEAERLLDALRAGEKNLQIWRFAKDKRKEAQRGEPDKDW